MILSHRYSFLFLKTNKTAGTSLEIALSRYCGPEDVILPMQPRDERIRRRLGYPGAQNHLTSDGKRRFREHMKLRGVQRSLPDGVPGNYFSFCFERHPFERVISNYHFKHGRNPSVSLNDYIANRSYLDLIECGRKIYSCGDAIAVDKVYLYEDLPGVLVEISDRLELPGPLEMPRAKAGFRLDRRSFSERLTVEQRAQLAGDFEVELERFGYEA